jgi:hypothetical protein
MKFLHISKKRIKDKRIQFKIIVGTNGKIFYLVQVPIQVPINVPSKTLLFAPERSVYNQKT